jgi:hypothetical protein
MEVPKKAEAPAAAETPGEPPVLDTEPIEEAEEALKMKFELPRVKSYV